MTLWRLATALTRADKEKSSRLIRELDAIHRDLGLSVDSSLKNSNEMLSSFCGVLQDDICGGEAHGSYTTRAPGGVRRVYGGRGHHMVAMVGFAHFKGVTDQQDLGL